MIVDYCTVQACPLRAVIITPGERPVGPFSDLANRVETPKLEDVDQRPSLQQVAILALDLLNLLHGSLFLLIVILVLALVGLVGLSSLLGLGLRLCVANQYVRLHCFGDWTTYCASFL